MPDSSLNFFFSKSYKHTISASMAIFLWLFLIFFLPFGVSNYDPHHQYTFSFIFEISIFLVVVYGTSVINEFLLKPLLGKRTTFAFVIGWTLWTMLFCGGIIFLIYNFLGDWHDWRLSSFPGFVLNVSSVLIFPSVGVFFYFRFKILKQQYHSILTNIENKIDSQQLLHFVGQGVNDKIAIKVDDFIYARAQDNYIELNYLNSGRPDKYLLRASMGKLFGSLDAEFIVRCHRSFFINLYQVNTIKGGKNDLTLRLNHTPTIISVSKTYAEDTLEGLKKFKDFKD